MKNKMAEDIKNRLPLDSRVSNRFVRIVQVVFGIVAALTAAWLAVFMLLSPEASYWIAVLFLFLFGLFQIYSGLGHATRYIEVDGDTITVKSQIASRPVSFEASSVESIEIERLSLHINGNGKKRVSVRFGVAYPGIIDNAKEGVAAWALKHGVSLSDEIDP